MNINLKLKIIYSASVLLLSFSISYGVNNIVKYVMMPTGISDSAFKLNPASMSNNTKKIINWDKILNSGFFVQSEPEVNIETEVEAAPPAAIRSLKLIGTVTGSRSFASAIIRNRSKSSSEIFNLTDNRDVYGYKLIAINNFSVVLKSGTQKYTIEMYGDDDTSPNNQTSSSTPSPTNSQKFNKTISRASILQETKNNMDNMLKGLRIGPYRENNKVVGYKLYKVLPTNMLFKLGARSGDVIRRINGHPIDSTNKLFQMWQNFTKETKFVIDLQRGNTIITYDFTITD